MRTWNGWYIESAWVDYEMNLYILWFCSIAGGHLPLLCISISIWNKRSTSYGRAIGGNILAKRKPRKTNKKILYKEAPPTYYILTANFVPSTNWWFFVPVFSQCLVDLVTVQFLPFFKKGEIYITADKLLKTTTHWGEKFYFMYSIVLKL